MAVGAFIWFKPGEKTPTIEGLREALAIDGVLGGIEELAGIGALVLADWSSLFFRFLLDEDSFSALSRTTFAIRSNSEQTPNMRFTPPFSPSVPSVERKVTTRFIRRTSDRARGS